MNPYQLLGVDPSASMDEVRRGYRRAAAKVHPDQGGEGEKFLQLVKARDVLLNPVARDRYDHTGQLPDEGKMQPAVAMIRALAVECAEKMKGVNLLSALREALKMKRAEFVKESMKYQLHMDRVEKFWEPGAIKTEIVQEFYERKAQYDFHALTVDKAIELLKDSKCFEITAPTWGMGPSSFADFS